MNTDSCVMTLQKDHDAVIDGPVGSFCIEQSDAEKLMILKLPDSSVSGIFLRPTKNEGPSWEWDGNLEKPTLTPSVNRPGGWHGRISSGKMEEW